MSARFRTKLGITNEDKLILTDLSEFPHGTLQGTKDHIDFYSVPKGIQVIALDEKTNQPILADVNEWSVHRDREVEIATLSSGKQIITDDDPRAIYGVDGTTLQWVRTTPSKATNVFVPIMDNCHTEVTPITEVPLVSGSTRINEKLPLDFDSGHLLGMLVGDGWASISNGKHKDVCLSASYVEIQEKYKALLTKILKEEPNLYHREITEGMLGNSTGSITLVYSSSELAKIIDIWIGHKAENKHLPPFWFSAPKEFKLGLLAGLWDSDGSVSYSHGKKKPQFLCNLASNSIRLAQEIQHLLRTLGVHSSLTASKSTTTGTPCWMLNVSSPDLYDLGGFKVSSTHKAKLFSEFLSNPKPDVSGSYSRYRLVPLPKKLAVDMRALILSSEKKVYSALTDAISSGYTSMFSANKLVEYFETNKLAVKNAMYPTWKSLATNNKVHFEKVIKVEKTGIKETGYDLSVPGYETFMSVDGIILSNTMNYHVPVSEAAVKEAIDKMMPSKNLLAVNNFDVHYLPTQEYLHGLYAATKPGKPNKLPRVFVGKTKDEAAHNVIQAYKRGEINADDPIVLKDLQGK